MNKECDCFIREVEKRVEGRGLIWSYKSFPALASCEQQRFHALPPAGLDELSGGAGSRAGLAHAVLLVWTSVWYTR